MDLEKGEKSVPLPGTDDPGMYEPTGSPLHESPSRSSGVSASTVPDHGGPPRPDDVDGADASRTISHEQQFIRASRTLSRIDSALTSASQRHSRVLSTLRSRDPAQDRPFHHPLEYQKTGESVIVDFDGPDDPYRPMNWPFKKKCITTMLFSLNTLCMYAPCHSLPVSLCISLLIPLPKAPPGRRPSTPLLWARLRKNSMLAKRSPRLVSPSCCSASPQAP